MKFPSGSAQDLLKLIGDHPLAWLVSAREGRFQAIPLPLLAETDSSGELVSLLGHCSRSNAQVAYLRENPQALVLFSGPHGYLSPSLVSNPTWVPTWNYAVAAIEVDVTFVEEETRESVVRLSDAMEAGLEDPWTIDRAGPRVGPMLERIVAFRADVRSVWASFKLGQDETLEALNELISGTSDRALADWMTRFNAERLPQGALAPE
ncbi:MAG: FMN-binding negative transcriptional regulator [Novosphingobium pentaromativorans]|uniref:FMN-binding negative transcriptional regulator n=1 Tax=Novosphingobium pentaromativorans TaxID=205844 RepID=A0A2W5NJL1_9SPHN|nr:MAG: FMN-binding negative transcriptional regulator [Novosphingobium pentaromativorans]